MRKAKLVVDDICEDYCFSCKDGGEIRGCDYKNCLKAYHPECVGKEISFLESNERWECAWHTCFICKNSAVYQCYCCANYSVCDTCIRDVEFVPLKKQNNNKGFCNNCLRLAILIEENIDVDSDGGKIDFTDTETFEYLFKEYWELVKDREGLSLQDLKAANKYLKKGKPNANTCDSAEIEGESEKASEEYIPESSDSFHPGSESRKRKSGSKKEPKSKAFLLLNKKWGAKKRNFIGWGSEELIYFLASIGKDTSEPISRSDACGIVEGYIKRNNLYHPVKKRKMVVSDEKLRALFGKGKFKTSKIYRMLESHFPGNEDSDDMIYFNDDEFEDEEKEEGSLRKKKKAQETAPPQVPQIREHYSEEKRRCRAKFVRENIDIIFLRRSIILELLKDPDTFNEKVRGCFVRVKHDLKDFYVKPLNVYQIGQVTGVIKGREEYTVGDASTNILLEISNVPKDMKLSSVTEETFDRMDWDDLVELARKGIYKMPTVGEIEDKLKVVHEVIMRDCIKRELVRLPKLIAQATLKGWWNEKYDYMEKNKLLQKPEEQERRIREIPVIIADPEEEGKIEKIEEKEDNKNVKIDLSPNTHVKQDNNMGKFVFLPDSHVTLIQNKVTAEAEISSQKVVPEVTGNASITQKVVPEVNGNAQMVVKTLEENGLAKDDGLGSESSNTQKSDTNGGKTCYGFTFLEDNKEALRGYLGNDSTDVFMENSEEIKVDDSNPISITEAISMQIEEVQIPDLNSPGHSQTLLNSQRVAAKDPKPNSASSIVIDLCDSDEEQNDQNTQQQSQEGNKKSESITSLLKGENDLVWYYMDPQGKQQGPFSVIMLRMWRNHGFFDDDFRVWCTGQSFKDSIVLEDLLAHR